MSILDLLLERVRSLLERGRLSPELQAQIDAIPDMVRGEDGDRDFPDSAYGISPLEPGSLSFKCLDNEFRPVRGLSNGGDPELSIPLRKDLNPDRVNPSCPSCYYFIGQPGLKCAVNPLGNPATCEHFKPI
jgi:hypothetical protein